MNLNLPQIFRVDSEFDTRGRLLIVDDDIRLADSLKELTVLDGYEVVVCNRGADAIDVLKTQPFDLALIDLVMPEMNGHELMDYMIAHMPSMPIIVVTATGTIQEAVRSLKKGVYDFIRKPYHPDELLKTIENAVRKSRLERMHQTTSMKLAQSENLYHYLVDSSPDLIYTLDNEGFFTFVNKRADTLLGYAAAELIGRHFSVLVHHDDVDHARYAFNERRTGDRASSNIELRLKAKGINQNGNTEAGVFEAQYITVVLNAKGLYDLASNDVELFIGTYGVARDISERKKTEELVTYQAYHDVLTGLPNRSLFKDRLSVSIAQAKRNKRMLGVMFLDLDRFKWVNDTLGHFYGDELLKGVADRLKKSLRQGDTLARIGGDEFTVILPDINSTDDASLIANKVLSSLEPPFILNDHEISMSASIGISIFPEDGDNLEMLTKCADIAMYHVKWEGKNGFRHYDKSMNAVFQSKLSIENELRKAIETEQLTLYFQPKVHMDSLQVMGFEALARWYHPDKGYIPPSEFIPLAEETGLIGLLTDWVIREACKAHKRLEAGGFGHLSIAINISPESLMRNDVVRQIMTPIHAEFVPAHAIEIEITESFLMRNLETSISKLKELSAQGIRISIDDFGTGYSSLSYLQKLPIHSVKIDKSFVHDIRHLDQDLPIISAIVAIAKGFHLEVIGEGIETAEHMEVLRSHGCKLMQGFLMSEPMPSEAILPFLHNQEAHFHNFGLNQRLALK